MRHARKWFTESHLVPVLAAPYSLESIDVYDLLMHLYPFYTGRWRVWRVSNREQIELIFSLFYNNLIVPSFSFIDDPDESYEFVNPLFYAIEDLQSGHVRWYMQGSVTYTSTGMKDNVPLCCFMDLIDPFGAREQSNFGELKKFTYHTLCLPTILDTFVYKATSWDDLVSLLRSELDPRGRKLEIVYDYHAKHKKFDFKDIDMLP